MSKVPTVRWPPTVRDTDGRTEYSPAPRCEWCDHWDKVSGLSARYCEVWGAYTTRYEFCSRGTPKKEAKT